MNNISGPHWFAKSIGSAAFTPVLLVSFLGFTLWSLGDVAGKSVTQQNPATVLSLLAVGLGCWALSWIRPQRAGLSPPHVMLSLGFGGMFLGLLYQPFRQWPFDLHNFPFLIISNLCLHICIAYIHGYYISLSELIATFVFAFCTRVSNSYGGVAVLLVAISTFS